jgi:hypothetical protein
MNVQSHEIADRMRGRQFSFRPAWQSIATRRWAICTLLIAAAICRLLTFVPQPIDSPHSLRPHLYKWFAAFVKLYRTPELAQASWHTICFWLLLIPPALALLNYFSSVTIPGKIRRILCSRVLLFVCIALALFVCRFPVLLADQMNPDEAQFLAAAQKLFVDPIFFRSVDCGTSGPLNIVPLMLPALVGFSPDYASSRVVALVIIVASVYFLYRAFSMVRDDAHARIAILPAAGAFAVLRNLDFLPFTSEHVSFLLLSLALFFCVKVFVRSAPYDLGLFALGLLTAAAFFAKMQAVPIIATVAIVALAYVYRTGTRVGWWRPVAIFVAGLAPFFLINVAVCLASGVLKDFWMSYIVANYRYTQAFTLGLGSFIDFVLGLREIRWLVATLLAIAAVHICSLEREHARSTSLYVRLSAVGGVTAVAIESLLRTSSAGIAFSYALMLCAFVFVGLVALMFQNESVRAMPTQCFGLTAAAVLAASSFAVYAPHRLFPHYALLLVIPLSIAISWPILARFESEEASGPRASSGLPLVLVFVTLMVTCQAELQAVPNPIAFASLQPGIRSPESDFVRSITQDQDRITVWGWNPKPYLGSGRVSATRDLNMIDLFRPASEVRAFYRDRFLRDMRRTPPSMFIDAVGPTSFDGEGAIFNTPRTGGFEMIPEIRSLVESNYVQVEEELGQRFYVRRNLPAGRVSAAQLKSCSGAAIRCFDERSSATDLPPLRMPDHAILDVVFTPETKQDLYATVFSSDASPTEQKGFQFHHVGHDQYRLAIGLDGQWAGSRLLLLPPKLSAALSFEFAANRIVIRYNGVMCEEMHMPRRMADTGAPITIGYWIGRQRLFQGKIQVFQIRDLTSAGQTR